MRREYNLDATGEKIGRLSSKIASLLMGKDKPDFQKNLVADVKVKVENASRLDIPRKKIEQKKYNRYSGYPGGRRDEKLEEVVRKKGQAELIRRAVRGMLPANKLRAILLKNLIIK